MRGSNKKRKHKHQVRETHCLNCEAVIHDEYCGTCGQKAHLHKDTFWHMVTHFIADYFHYDGKFLTTIKTLFTKPGALTLEYVNGKRVKYINPIQLYIFVSAIFFLIFYAFINRFEKEMNEPMSVSEIIEDYEKVAKFRDSTFSYGKYKPLDFGFQFDRNGFILHDKVSKQRQHDSIEATLTPDLQEGFIKSYFHRKILSLNELNLTSTQLGSLWFRTYVSTFPKAFFVLLPFFAFILLLVYHKKWYVDHLIFSIHFHVFTFIVIIGFLSISSFIELFDHPIFFTIGLVVLLIYLYKAMLSVYQSHWGIVLLKMFIVALLYAAVLFITMFMLILLSILLL